MMINTQEASSNTQVIWGTNINQNDIQVRMKNFINTYVYMGENDDDFTKPPYYIDQLKLIMDTEQYVLDIDCDHIYQFDQLLYKQLENYPSDVIPMFDLVVSQCYKEHHMGGLGGLNGQNPEGRTASQLPGSSGINQADEDSTNRDVLI